MGAANCACGGPILSKMGVSIFRTPRSIFRIAIFSYFSAPIFRKFAIFRGPSLFLEPSPVSGFLAIFCNRELLLHQALQKMVADAEETRNGAGGEEF